MHFLKFRQQQIWKRVFFNSNHQNTGILPDVFPATKSSVSITASRWVVFDAFKYQKKTFKHIKHVNILCILWLGKVVWAVLMLFCSLRRRQLRPSSPMKPQAPSSAWYWKDFEFYMNSIRGLQGYIISLILLMEEIPNNHLGCIKPCK